MTGTARVRRAAVWSLAAFGLIPAFAAAEEAKCLSATGSIIVRDKPSSPWKSLEQGATVPAGALAVTLPDATIASSNGAVKITARADYDGRSPLPILETAIVLGEPAKGFDLDLAIDRGRVELLNTKKSGSAKVQLRFQEQKWVVDLDEPGSRVTVEKYGRHPNGTVFRPGQRNEPHAQLIVLVTDKTAHIDTGTFVYSLTEPPGSALLAWDSQTGQSSPARLTALPEWADPDVALSEEGKQFKVLLEEFRKVRVEKGVDEALDAFFESGNPLKERIAMVSMGSQDDLPRLGKALGGTRSSEVWNTGAVVVRHWLGRKPGQDQLLYTYLGTVRKYTPVQSRIIMQLLLGFDAEALQTPELYEMLIEYLKSDTPGIRNLAAWHLYRLMPAMRKKVPFEPNAPKEVVAKLYDAWKLAIPDGKLPPVEVVPEKAPKTP